MLKSNINIVYKLIQKCNTDTIDKQTMKTYFLSKINIYYKLILRILSYLYFKIRFFYVIISFIHKLCYFSIKEC